MSKRVSITMSKCIKEQLKDLGLVAGEVWDKELQDDFFRQYKTGRTNSEILADFKVRMKKHYYMDTIQIDGWKDAGVYEVINNKILRKA